MFVFLFVKVIWIYALASVGGNLPSWLETLKPDKLCAPVDTKGLAFKFNLCGKSSQFGLIFYFSDKLCEPVDTQGLPFKSNLCGDLVWICLINFCTSCVGLFVLTLRYLLVDCELFSRFLYWNISKFCKTIDSDSWT